MKEQCGPQMPGMSLLNSVPGIPRTHKCMLLTLVLATHSDQFYGCPLHQGHYVWAL